MPATICTLALVLSLPGCVSRHDTVVEVGATRAYRCEDGFTFVTRAEPQRVWLFTPGLTTSVPQVPSASGLHYRDSRIVLRVSGDRATLELEGRVHVRCVNQPEQARWEDARLRGVDVRAVGPAGDWTVEVDAGRRLVLELAGEGRIVFPPPAEHHAHGRTIYQSGMSDRHLRLEVEERPCRNTAEGEALPLSVSVTLNKRIFHGCGRRLSIG